MKLNQRYLQKLKTRSIIIQSALTLMGEHKSFSSLSLREVAGKADIVPAAFYRHFKDMEELGLAIVDDVSVRLRNILREARKKGAYKTALKVSMALFFEYVKNNRTLFRFLIREKHGESERIRLAIRNEMNFISAELASDMKRPGMPFSALEFIAGFIVTTSFNLAEDFLEVAPNDRDSQRKIQSKSLSQLRLIFKGAISRNKTKKRV
jgi:TetR/AcrR family transcriptional regulator, fatty acid biosynthesis regulator